MIEFPALGITAPDGSIMGIIADQTPHANALRVGPGEAIPDSAAALLLDHALAAADAVTKARAVAQLIKMRMGGVSIALVSHDEPLLESCADEIWWIAEGRVVERGDPGEVLLKYRAHVATILRAGGTHEQLPLTPSMRRGDGRASIEAIDLLGQDGNRTAVWQSGEAVTIGVAVRFEKAVENPVVGIMIRTRIGLNVYGTNTELEKIAFGPVQPSSRYRVAFRFDCNLCPGEYTVTAASHDPDGVWHDWLQDAVAFAVVDARYTAGVANLRAKAEASIL